MVGSDIAPFVQRVQVGETGRVGRIRSGQVQDEAEARAVATGIALKQIYKKYGVTHAISFHASIRAADRFRDAGSGHILGDVALFQAHDDDVLDG